MQPRHRPVRRPVVKILLYGGAFNPPHLGHEKLLEAAVAFVKPDLTLVTPTGTSPHKRPADVPYFERALLARTFRKLSGTVVISGIESRGRGRSYTIRTVRRIRRKYPGSRIFLLIGSDMLLTFDEWKSWRRLAALVTVVAAVRAGADAQGVTLAARMVERAGGTVELMPFEPLEVSSSQLRKKLEERQSCAGLLDGEVERRALQRGIYDRGRSKQSRAPDAVR